VSTFRLASTTAVFVALLATPLSRAAIANAQAPAPSAAPVLDARSAAHVRDAYLKDLDTLHAKILGLANAIPADKYSWRPAKGVRSISEALMHVASEWYVYTPLSIGSTAPDDFVPKTTTAAAHRDAMNKKLADMEKTTDKAAVLAELDRSWKYCRGQLLAAKPAELTAAYKPWGMPLDNAAFVMVDDLHEHLGQLIAYARSVGVTPPWSK
jgi:uncharacterized damage-inducible protein DinB